MEEPDFLNFLQDLPKQYSKALISIFTQNKNHTEHIGSGFLCIKNKESNELWLMTAKHVIDSIKDKNNTFCCFSLGFLNFNKEIFSFIPIEKFNFSFLEEYDIAFSLIDESILKILSKSKSLYTNLQHSITPLISTNNNLISTQEVLKFYSIIGFTANDNLRKVNYQKYKRNWHNIFTVLEQPSPKIIEMAQSKEAIFLHFDRKNTISLNKNKSIGDLSIDNLNDFKDGNHTDLGGMSGSPCIQFELNDKGTLMPRACGVLIEHLHRPPANGKFMVVIPITKIFEKIIKK